MNMIIHITVLYALRAQLANLSDSENQISLQSFVEELHFRKDGPLCRELDLTSKPDKLVALQKSASFNNR